MHLSTYVPNSTYFVTFAISRVNKEADNIAEAGKPTMSLWL